MATLENIKIKRKSFLVTFIIFLGLQALSVRPDLFLNLFPKYNLLLWSGIFSLILWLGVFWICKNVQFIISSERYLFNKIKLPFRITSIHLLILPTMLLWGSILSNFFLFFEDLLFQQIIIFSSTILLYILIFKLDYNIQNLSILYQNVINITIFFTVFLWYSLIFYFYLFFGWPKWAVILSVFIISFLITYQALLKKNIPSVASWVYILITVLILSEITWVITFWPVVYLIGGMVILTSFYVVWGLIQDHIDNKLELKIILEYLAVAFTILAIVLATTRWISPYM